MLLKGAKNSNMPALSWDLANFVVRTGEDVYLKMLLADNVRTGRGQLCWLGHERSGRFPSYVEEEEKAVS